MLNTLKMTISTSVLECAAPKCWSKYTTNTDGSKINEEEVIFKEVWDHNRKREKLDLRSNKTSLMSPKFFIYV